MYVQTVQVCLPIIHLMATIFSLETTNCSYYIESANNPYTPLASRGRRARLTTPSQAGTRHGNTRELAMSPTTVVAHDAAADWSNAGRTH